MCYVIQPPGMCRATVTCFLENQVRVPHRRARGGPDFIPPPLLLHTGNPVVLSVVMTANIVQPDVLAFLKGQMTTLVPDSSMCNLLLEGTMVPLAVCSPKWEPHPS